MSVLNVFLDKWSLKDFTIHGISKACLVTNKAGDIDRISKMRFVAVLNAIRPGSFFITSKTSTSFCFQSDVFFPIDASNIIEYVFGSVCYLHSI